MAYKVFTNGSPLPASDLNTYLMNQSVMVFANSTARSAALTAPTEGMMTYLEDTNLVYVYTGAAWVDINDNTAAIPKSTVTTAGDLIVANGNASVTRLGIGTNGQFLSSNGTTATWVNGPSSGSLTLISSTALSGTSVSLTSIPGTYKGLNIQITNPTHNASVSSQERIDFRFNSDSAANYYINTFTTSSNTSPNNEIFVSPAINSTTLNTYCNFWLWGYAGSTIKTWENYSSGFNSNGSVNVNRVSYGIWNSTTAINSIEVRAGQFSNTFTGGTVNLYGVN